MRVATSLTAILILGACGRAIPTDETRTTIPATPTAAVIDGVVGTAHPAIVQSVDPEGRWVFLCQARRDTDGENGILVITEMHGELFGDEVLPYLVLGSGPGERIDAFLGSDESGRWVLVRRAGAIELIDVSTMQRTSLGASPPEPASPLRPHPFFDFEGGSLARVGAGGAVLVRELETGREARIDPGPGLLVGVRLEPDAEAVSLDVVARDGDGDGRIAAPMPQTSLAGAGACRGSPSSYSVAGHRGDGVERRIAPARGGLARTVEGLVATWRGDAIVRTADGAIVLDDGTPTRVEIAPASCAAELLVPARRSDALLVYCHDDGDLMSWRGGAMEPLGVAVPVVGREETARPGVFVNRSLRLTAGSTREVTLLGPPTLAIELASGAVTRFPEDLWSRAIYGRHVVFEQQEAIVVAALGSGATVARFPLEGRSHRAAGRFFALDGQVIDIASASLLGRYEGHFVSLASDGRVLVAPERDRGPLTWRVPRPIESAGAAE